MQGEKINLESQQETMYEISDADRERFRQEYQQIGRQLLQKQARLSGLILNTIHANDEERASAHETILQLQAEITGLIDTLGAITLIVSGANQLPKPVDGNLSALG
jgi:hypothetical protein